MKSVAFALIFVASCAHNPSPSPPSSGFLVKLQVIAEPDSAVVELDEEFFGSAKVLALKPKVTTLGAHRLSIRADGYFPHDMDVDLANGTTKLRIKLRPIPE